VEERAEEEDLRDLDLHVPYELQESTVRRVQI